MCDPTSEYKPYVNCGVLRGSAFDPLVPRLNVFGTIALHTGNTTSSI